MNAIPYLLSRILFFLFTGVLINDAYSQSSDSVLQHIATLPTDLEKIQYLEQQIDHLYRVQPAQALVYAQRADSLASLVDSLPLSLEIQRLRALPLRVRGDYEQAQTILQHAIEQLPPAPTSSTLAAVRARVHTNRAVLYRLQGDMLGSVAESQRAIHQLDSLIVRYPRARKYHSDLSDAYNGLAITHGRLENYALSNRYFRKSLRIDEQLGDQESIDGVLFNLGSNFYLTNQYDSAEYYWLSVVERTDTTTENSLSNAIYQNLGLLAAKQEKWDEAQQYYYQALHRYEQQSNYAAAASIYQSLAYLHNDLKEYELARQEALNGLSMVGQNLRSKSLLHHRLADAYQGMHRYQPAAEHYQQYAILQDSLLNQEKAEAIAEMEAKYQHEQQEKELALQQQEIELLHQDNHISRLQRNMTTMGLLLLTLVGVSVTFGQRLKIRRKQEQLRDSQALTATVRENAQLKEQQLRQELDHRNQQLTSYTLNFVQKNELMSELRDRVESLQQRKQWSSRDFRQLKTHIQQHLSIDQDWEHFKLHFESVHPNFFRSLAAVCPELGPKERKLCALIRLNLNIKEAAAILGISPDSVKTARHRLRKKLRMGSEESILDVLMHIEQGMTVPETSTMIDDS